MWEKGRGTRAGSSMSKKPTAYGPVYDGNVCRKRSLKDCRGLGARPDSPELVLSMTCRSTWPYHVTSRESMVTTTTTTVEISRMPPSTDAFVPINVGETNDESNGAGAGDGDGDGDEDEG
ncbi:hypothetical protein P8C59_002896 [Phyllachora maydis]|uniref:Uncharacterized protein n=1 Tax=Phyllachora maydis TaxID=1825666 RepID=A0AAD9I0B1_9PEZI|nr:hypothetical protein P8C59_002896 [Phyllachora maydis]